MLVFCDSKEGNPRIAGTCEIYVPHEPIYEFVTCDTRIGRRNYRLAQVGFPGREMTIQAIRLSLHENPEDLPGFRQAEGYA
jgi:hypothetical protein